MRGVAQDQLEERLNAFSETADHVDDGGDAREFNHRQPAQAVCLEGRFQREQHAGEDLQREHQQEDAAARFYLDSGIMFPVEVAHADGTPGERRAGNEATQPPQARQTP